MTTATKNEITQKIELNIAEEPYIEMMQYAHEFSPDECSGMGLVEKVDFDDGSVEFNVSKVFLPNQTNSACATDIEDEELNKLNTKLVEDGEDTSLLRFHWHSHVDMSVFHSGTDDENYDELQTGDYAVSLVVNKKYEMLGSVHLYKPLRINVLNIEVNPPDTIDLDEYKLPKDLRKKIEANVERVKAYEEEQRKSKWAGFGSNVTVHHRGKDNWGSDEYLHDSFGSGLEYDSDFYSLLVQGEKAGLITLFYDQDNNKCVVGYQNLRTHVCYEIVSYEDYTNYNY